MILSFSRVNEIPFLVLKRPEKLLETSIRTFIELSGLTAAIS